ncbi:MAG: exo-beta-N-acetylmuramidase NamZ domain-containing protein, partial [Verrucomicrobiota bacterium]
GGLKVDGPPLDKHLMSYVGAFRVPYVHGLTIGELALMAKHIPGWLEVPESVRQRGKLYVVPMRGWRRDMLWSQTGLRWTPPSPAIPDLSAAVGYSMTGLGCQLGDFRHGYGQGAPFRLLSYPGKSPQQLAYTLNALSLPGVEFRPLPDWREQQGVYVVVNDWEKLKPTALSFYLMRLAASWGDENPFAAASKGKARLFNIHVGSQAWWEELTTRGKRARVETFLKEWDARAKEYQRWSKHYWLYE